MSNYFDYNDLVQESVSRLRHNEQVLGKGLNIPNNATNSGSRKIMNGTHQSHTLVLNRGMTPYVSTGFENRFGDYSSSIIKLNYDYVVLAKISKFSQAPNHHYWLIIQNLTTSEIDVIERVSYKWKTEVYGYLINNSYIDSLVPGSSIPKGEPIVHSIGFDQYGNKTAGCELNVMYNANDENMEDSVIISDVCMHKMATSLLKNVDRIINENDIPLNLYGDENVYKIFPDIGEDVKNGILMAYRRENKEEAIYTQAINRLRELMMSDDKIVVKGKVLDINIYCNNVDFLTNSVYNAQFNKYYQERMRMCNEIIATVGPYQTNGYTLSYNLQKLFFRCIDEINGKKVMTKKPFSNIYIEYILLEERLFDVGDKCADRYGGKGVVSTVYPQHMMPKLPNGEYADMIKNSSTMYGRENPGQIFEMSINYISMCILDYLRKTPDIQPEDAYEFIFKFLGILVPEEEKDMRNYVQRLDADSYRFFLNTILEQQCIHVSAMPMSDTVTIDTIMALYDTFPWIKPVKLTVPIEDSKGNIRYVPTRKATILTSQYNLRLKQFAEEKFSATSLSSTNIMGENAKSKANKAFKELYSNTPIKFGPMETGDLAHMGTDAVIGNLMIHSLSPSARRQVEELYTGDPYDIDIHLNPDAKNRSVEKLNARLKTMGYKIVFRKRKRVYTPAIKINAISFMNGKREAVSFNSKNYDFKRWYRIQKEKEDILKRCAVVIPAVEFDE